MQPDFCPMCGARITYSDQDWDNADSEWECGCDQCGWSGTITTEHEPDL